MRPWLFEGSLPLLGEVAVPAYYFWLAMAFVVGVNIAVREAKRSGERVDRILDLAMIALVSSLVGARLGHIVFVEPENYLADPLRLLQVWRGGFVMYGGLLTCILTMGLYVRWRGMGFWRVCDISAPVLAVGIGLGRLGCLSAGCCYGRPVDWPFGVAMPWGIVLDSSQVPIGLRDVALHPTQAWTSLLGLALFLYVGRIRRKPAYDGQAFLHVVALYAVGRSLIEVFRFDTVRGVYWGVLSTSQLISVPLLVGAVLAMTLLARRARA
jgi:phosphatidylglycerol---prolipoprotein diacylglyceryl transferase